MSERESPLQARRRYELMPVSLKQARAFVNAHHEHNEAPVGWRFGTGLGLDGELVGVAIVGRPTARGIDHELYVEITRVCIDEVGVHKNAASRLYGAACRMAAAGGYRRAYTYTIEGEDAASVRAAGFVLDAVLPAGESWNRPSRPRMEETLFGERKRPRCVKYRWRRDLVATAVAA